ncbi:hypothetical protein [Burkholderia ubonensis]|uniref:hypothetical protein n=1 Tax=Burkholderia ubonensis TaxID=101571 RepID=UPI000AF0FBC1|nr:hypothetical protein [Burkholderia ubonensis]
MNDLNFSTTVISAIKSGVRAYNQSNNNANQLAEFVQKAVMTPRLPQGNIQHFNQQGRNPDSESQVDSTAVRLSFLPGASANASVRQKFVVRAELTPSTILGIPNLPKFYSEFTVSAQPKANFSTNDLSFTSALDTEIKAKLGANFTAPSPITPYGDVAVTGALGSSASIKSNHDGSLNIAMIPKASVGAEGGVGLTGQVPSVPILSAQLGGELGGGVAGNADLQIEFGKFDIIIDNTGTKFSVSPEHLQAIIRGEAGPVVHGNVKLGSLIAPEIAGRFYQALGGSATIGFPQSGPEIKKVETYTKSVLTGTPAITIGNENLSAKGAQPTSFTGEIKYSQTPDKGTLSHTYSVSTGPELSAAAGAAGVKITGTSSTRSDFSQTTQIFEVKHG